MQEGGQRKREQTERERRRRWVLWAGLECGECGSMLELSDGREEVRYALLATFMYVFLLGLPWWLR